MDVPLGKLIFGGDFFLKTAQNVKFGLWNVMHDAKRVKFDVRHVKFDVTSVKNDVL